MVNSTPRYDWKRFWCPREGRIWADESGYLLDPEGPHKNVQSYAVPFDVIEAVPCLLMLGEPGIGKTDAMEMASSDVKASLPFGEEHLHIDCRKHRDLKEDLFDDPKFKGWFEGRHALHLFIDGLDEHPSVDAAARILGKLERGPIDKLRLRIACRTAQIPPNLEPELRKLWTKDAEGNERFAVYELAPLRKKDVAVAAQAEGLNEEEFLSAVANRGASALAIKPVTLKFLLNMFRASIATRSWSPPSSRTRGTNAQARPALGWADRTTPAPLHAFPWPHCGPNDWSGASFCVSSCRLPERPPQSQEWLK